MIRKPLINAFIGLLTISIASAETYIPPGPVYGIWEALGSPYLIQGEITIPYDSTLIIEPGVEVIFQEHYKFIVNGYLEALGTESDSIHFSATYPFIGWHGIRFIDAPDSSHLRYCTIQYGWASGDSTNPDGYGGGIYCENSNPVFLHCRISDNDANTGGGIYCDNSNPRFDHCNIYRNESGWWAGGICCTASSPIITNSHVSMNSHTGIVCHDGSNAMIDNCTVNENLSHGIYCYNSSPTINNCIIRDNWEFVAAGIWCEQESNPVIRSCTITGNCGGSGVANGGIVCQHNSNPRISYCTISDNDNPASAGGISCLFASNPTIEYCLITGNSGSIGGIYCGQNSSVCIDHCTISGNSGFAGYGAGAICFSYADNPVIINTIVEGNLGDVAIMIYYSQSPSISYCDFHNNQNGNFVGEIPPGLGELVTQNLNNDSCDTFYNIFLDPLFEDTPSGNYHLLTDSPCIDAGDPSSPYDPDSTITDIGAFYFNQTGVRPGHPEHGFPSSFILHQNYPNPFNPTTTITFNLPLASHATLSVYNILGRRIDILANGWHTARTHKITFNGSNLPSGIYFYELSTNNYHAVKKAILLK